MAIAGRSASPSAAASSTGETRRSASCVKRSSSTTAVTARSAAKIPSRSRRSGVGSGAPAIAEPLGTPATLAAPVGGDRAGGGADDRRGASAGSGRQRTASPTAPAGSDPAEPL